MLTRASHGLNSFNHLKVIYMEEKAVVQASAIYSGPWHIKALAASTYIIHTHMHDPCINWKGYAMRTTLNIEDTLLERASRLTGVNEKTSLVRLGLEALIALESAKRLAKLGGTEKSLRVASRRKTSN